MESHLWSLGLFRDSSATWPCTSHPFLILEARHARFRLAGVGTRDCTGHKKRVDKPAPTRDNPEATVARRRARSASKPVADKKVWATLELLPKYPP